MSTEVEPSAPTVSFETTLEPVPTERLTEGPEDSVPPEASWSRLMGSHAQRYRFIRKLGAGGMGVVYLAHDTKLERNVAIKALRGAASEKLYRRLLREAQALAKLSHPNVVQVFDVDVIEDELRVSMQYVEGQTLRAWLDAAPRDLQAILEVFCKAGEGLAAAHKANLTHRDFKPDNVLIDLDGQVRVADFGLARSSDDSDGDAGPGEARLKISQHDLTQTGAFVGTPLYMAPELFDEAEKRGSTLSDQYAFCVTLYEALYGQPPFWGSNFWNLAAAIAEGEIAKPDPENARVAKIPKAVERAIRRGMSRNPSDRFATMGDLLKTLNRAAKAAGRRPRRLILGAIGSTAVLAGAAYLGVRWVDARAYERECVAPARILYSSGTGQGLLNARETMERCEVGPERHAEAAAELLRVDRALLYGAGDQAPPRVLPPGLLTGPDSLVASVGVELWDIGSEASGMELAAYPQLWERARAKAEGWIDTLELAGAKSARFVVAPENHLWLLGLIVALAPDSGVDVAELSARLDSAIADTRDPSSGRPQFLLIHFRAELEPDHERAASLIRGYLDEAWAAQEGSKDLYELLRAEQAYRLALALLSSKDEDTRRRVASAATIDGQALQSRSPRLDLAQAALALANGEEPAKLRGDLDRARASAPTLWWDPRFINALASIETAVIQAEQEAAREQAKSELLEGFASRTIAASDAIARASELRDRGDDDWRLALLIADARVEIARADPSPETLAAAKAEYEAFIAEAAAPAKVLDQARETLAGLGDAELVAPEPSGSEPKKPPKVGRVEVTFNKGDYTTAVFEVSGMGGSFQAAPNLGKSLPAKRLRIRCQALHASAWTDWASITPRDGATIRCTKQGVKSDR